MQKVTWQAAVAAVAGLCLMALPAAAQDNVEGPWGTPNGDIYGLQRPNQALGDWSGGFELAWEYDPANNGLSRTHYQMSQIVFDAAGNIYWISASSILASVDPDGIFRWALPLNNGSTHGGSPVVGEAAVYAVHGGDAVDTDGDGNVGVNVGAYNKADGGIIWEYEIDPPGFYNAGIGPHSPVLYNGKLYVATIGVGYGMAVTQLDAATGNMDWHNVLDPLAESTTAGTMAFAPDLYGADLHGLFLNVDDGPPDFVAGTGQQDVFGVRIDPHVGATLEWVANGGKLARAHVIYSPETQLVYAHTWTDHEIVEGEGGTSFTVYDGLTGTILDTVRFGSFGYSDCGGLDFDDKSVVAGSFQGEFWIHVDNDGDGVVDEAKKYKSDRTWFGEPRCIGSLYQWSGKLMLLTGTSSDTETDPTRTSRVVIHDLSGAMVPGTDDGPLYVDDIDVFEGTDYNNAINNPPSFTVDFESFTVPGRVDQDAAWADISGPNGGAAMVVADPTGGGQGTVMMLDPYGNEMLPDQNQGARWTLPFPVGGWDNNNPPPEPYVVIRWKQWRADTTDNVEILPDNGGLPGSFQWDLSGLIYTTYSWASFYAVGVETWDEIELRYDFMLNMLEVWVNGNTDGPPDFIWDFANPPDPVPPIELYRFYMLPTPPVTNDGVPWSVPFAEYDAGGTGHMGFPHQRGGPLRGPDGKVYYFRNADAFLVALRPAAPTDHGDMDCDGDVDAFDIDPFVLALTNRERYLEEYPDCYFMMGDMDCDGDVDAFDIDPFVICLTTGNCGCP